MAKKKRYRKGGPARLDMRKGGRVRLHGDNKVPYLFETLEYPQYLNT